MQRTCEVNKIQATARSIKSFIAGWAVRATGPTKRVFGYYPIMHQYVSFISYVKYYEYV